MHTAYRHRWISIVKLENTSEFSLVIINWRRTITIFHLFLLFFSYLFLRFGFIAKLSSFANRITCDINYFSSFFFLQHRHQVQKNNDNNKNNLAKKNNNRSDNKLALNKSHETLHRNWKKSKKSWRKKKKENEMNRRRWRWKWDEDIVTQLLILIQWMEENENFKRL